MKPGRRQEYIRISNMKSVLRAIRGGGKTFAELENIMGLSNAAIFKIVSAMTESGLVLRNRLPSSTAGRKAEIITPNPAFGYFAVILAHSDVMTVTVNDFVGNVVYKKEYQTGYVVKREILDAAVEDMKKVALRPKHTVFVFAGKYDCKTDRFVFAGKFAEFYGENFSETLSRKIGSPVIMKNDMFTAVQAATCDASSPDSFLYLYIDEGVGGGIVCEKHIFAGEHGMAGEFGLFGMNPMTATDFFPNDRSEIFSTLLSVKSVAARYRRCAGKPEVRYEEAKEDFIAACGRKDETALSCLDEAVGVLGRFLWSVTELLDISHILFAGEFVRLEPFVVGKLNRLFSHSPTCSKIEVSFLRKRDEVYNGAVSVGLSAFEEILNKKQ